MCNRIEISYPRAPASRSTDSPRLRLAVAANDHISLKLTGYKAAEKMDVSLTDITGKVIGTLYAGNVGSMPQEFALPAVSAGLYFVNITIAGKTSAKKLSIVH